MKKNLLTLSILLLSIHSIAQDTYVGDKAVVKVEANTLFYNGGNFVLNASANSSTANSLDNVVINKGNIIINEGFRNTNTETGIYASNGDEFLNVYTSNIEYGQVIINGSNDKTTGKMTVQKKSVLSVNNGSNSTNGVQQLPIAFPFRGKVETIMNSFSGKNESNFRGNCGLDVTCNQRYWMTLFKWNNNKIVNDAVTTGSELTPGAYYLLNIVSNTGLHTEFNGTNIINYKGVPAPARVQFGPTKTVIKNFSENDFKDKTYSQWKNLRNNYNELYYTYIGNGTSAENGTKSFGKNFYRFGNPYTSNLNLSVRLSTNPVDLQNNWIKFYDNTGQNLQNLKTFELSKLAQTYKHTWSSETGSSHNSTGSDQIIRAKFASGTWTGDNEAILIRPLEMFSINVIDEGLINLDVELTDLNKTFVKQIGVSSAPLSPRSLNNSAFHQLKISLYDNENNIISEPVYLANASNLNTAQDIINASERTMLLLEEDVTGDVIVNAKSLINTFNADDYVGKPLHLELNNLAVGSNYKFRFNLKENSIFTSDVNQFNSGYSFYLHDKLNNSYTPIIGSTEIAINVDNNIKDRFTFFWREIPRTLGTDELNKNFKTQVYKFSEDKYKVRLNSSKKSANIEIYTIAGVKVTSQSIENISNLDESLKIPYGENGLYIIKVIYNDGTQDNIKLLVD